MANKNSIIDLEDLLGLKDFDKHTLEYDLQLMINDSKEYEERQQRKEEFIELFKECYDEYVFIWNKTLKEELVLIALLVLRVWI